MNKKIETKVIFLALVATTIFFFLQIIFQMSYVHSFLVIVRFSHYIVSSSYMINGKGCCEYDENSLLSSFEKCVEKLIKYCLRVPNNSGSCFIVFLALQFLHYFIDQETCDCS